MRNPSFPYACFDCGSAFPMTRKELNARARAHCPYCGSIAIDKALRVDLGAHDTIDTRDENYFDRRAEYLFNPDNGAEIMGWKD